MQPVLRHGLLPLNQLTACMRNGVPRSIVRTHHRNPIKRDSRILREALTTACSSRRWLHASAKQAQHDDTGRPASFTSKAAQNRPASSQQTAGALPSDAATKRLEISERIAKLVDGVLARASIASQHINAYTGTDYSGIESLRKEITQQESKVRSYHGAVEQAKKAHEEELAKQGSSQKEIVSLLERKSQWSPSDLERYMALVRTEHVHEQALQSAKNRLNTAERDLENARGFLEKLERKQYHEEQIWSDTIRRNSTWVTFGLMGVNIILLLAQISIFEPYRRKKIILEMKAALDEKSINAAPLQIERQIDAFTHPPGTLEYVEGSRSSKTVVASEEDMAMIEPAPTILEPSKERLNNLGTWESYKARVVDFFSERSVQMKQIDVTKIALQGVAAGAIAAGATTILVFGLLLKPK